MYTIYDYINYYKNTEIKDVKWNNADNLICSILCYLHIDSFKGVVNLRELYDLVINYKKDKDKSVIGKKAKDILKIIMNSIRYKDMMVSNFVNIRNNYTQFGAGTFRLNKITVVAYKGTDGSFIGWVENIRLSYIYPTYTQSMAIKYLNDNIKLFKDHYIYVVGHSKGGNLAMAASMETKDYIYRRIINVINFDGPGFMYEQFISDKYQKLKVKLVNIIPSGSIVGVLLENENYTVIRSNELAWNQHYPTSWLMFGEYFINGRLSNISNEIHSGTSINIRNLDKKKLKETFEILYKNLDRKYADNKKFTFAEVYQIYKDFKNIDPKVKENLDLIVSSLLKAFKVGKIKEKN